MFSVPKILTERYIFNEVSMSKYIPYKAHWQNDIILTKDNQLVRIIRVEGISFEAINDIDLEIKKQLRNTLFKGLSSGYLSLYFHLVRQRNVKLPHLFTDTNIEFVKFIKNKWNNRQSNALYFSNDLYITVIYQLEKQGIAFFEYWYKRLMQTQSKDYWIRDMKRLEEDLNEVGSRIINSLSEYNPKILELKPDGKCEMLQFLYSILNCGISRKTLLPISRGIDEILSQNRITFKQKHLEVEGNNKKKYASTIGIKSYPQYTSTIMLDGFLKTNYEFILTQSFHFVNKNVAIGKIQLQQNRMIQSEDKSISQIMDISTAMDLATSGDVVFGYHHLSMLCIADTEQDLNKSVSLAVTELSNYGIQAVRDTVNLEPVFWGQLPGNKDYIVRSSIIHTINLSGLCSMHNYPKGKKSGNHWGEYVSILDTPSKTPYYFSFHVRDVGHTIIVGPTGAGKTVLMNFLCAELLKFNPKMYFFDKDHGAEIFIRALNGTYNSIQSKESYSLNPLKLDDNEDNRNFLFSWFEALLTTNGERLSSEDRKTINQAIEGNYKLNLKDRQLSNLAPFFGISRDDNIAARLEIWYGSGAKASLFDNAEDFLDLTKNKVFGFEMSTILKDKIGLPPTLLYVFHKIQIHLTGEPTVIILDEAWALIDNPVFGPKIKDWLKVLRKLNTFVVFATQSIEDATKSSISDTLIQQTSTQIFLPNLKATREYKTVFMLSDREFDIVRTTDPGSRYFLVKQGSHSIVAKIDLSYMAEAINILSGRAETVQLLNQIIEVTSSNPKDWFYQFCQEANKINK